MARMQWWMRPGPSRPWAISKPRPSPRITFSLGTRTSVKLTSPWPNGSSSLPNTVSMRSIVTPGASIGTSTMLWRACFGASGRLRPMNTSTLQSGWPMPVLHHLRPLSTTSSPSSIAVACMLVASLLATPGSVMQKAERMLPSSSGLSQRSCCCGLPYFTSTSMLPVSGALQLKISGAISERPITSASGAYSALLRPAPHSFSGRNRFHRPAARALALSASITGGTFQGHSPRLSWA